MILHTKILVGSSYFFSKGKDVDFVVFENSKKYIFYKQVSRNSEDVFYWNVKNVLEYDYSKNPMAVGKFLVPEILEALDLKFNDVKELIQNHIYNLNKKHQYQVYIFESYLKNNKMKLTKKQLNEAKKIYNLNSKNN